MVASSTRHGSIHAVHGVITIVFVYRGVFCAGIIPEELGGLAKLENLSLGDNKLSGKGIWYSRGLTPGYLYKCLTIGEDISLLSGICCARGF